VSSLAEAMAGEPIRGSWWSHPKGRLIFAATRFVRDSPDVLLCRLIGGKLVYVHRRLWPALVCLGDELASDGRLDAIREVHSPTGAHRLDTIRFPDWVPSEVMLAGKQMEVAHARRILAPVVDAPSQPRARRGRNAEELEDDGVSKKGSDLKNKV
jgi:hypothetical protein